MSKGTRYSFVEEYFAKKVKPGASILETGCGGALYRQNIVGLKAKYTGCDVPNPYYQEGNDVDIYCSGDILSFADKSFDLVFNQGAFDYIPNPQQTIAETYRVLRPGGIFTIFTYRKDILEIIDRNCKKRGRKWENSHHVFSSFELTNWLNAQGFISKEITQSLDTIQANGFKREIMDFFNIYYPLQAIYSIWRIYEAKKPI